MNDRLKPPGPDPSLSTRETDPIRELSDLRSQLTTLQGLIQAQERAALTRADELDRSLEEVQQSAAGLTRAEQLLESQKRLLESILASMSDGVVVAGNDGRFVEFNPAAERILGVGMLDISPSEWAEKYQLFLPDRETPYPAKDLPLARAIRGESVDEVEIYVRQGATEGIWLSVNARPLRDENGVISGGVAVFRDVTEQRRSQETVQRLSTAVEQTADTVFITALDGTILYVNPAFERTTGYGSSEVLGKTPRILKSGQHPTDYYGNLWETIVTGEVFRGTTINRKKNGEFYHAEQTITPLRDPAGQVTHFVAVVKDMTERRRIEAQEIEMKVASLVQKRLYPQRALSLGGFEIAGTVVPAAATCGDYFDFFPMPRDAIGIAIGDVSGHGLGPALVMAETRAYLRSLANELPNIGRIFERINDILVDDLDDRHYVTMLMVRLDLENRFLHHCNAGHVPGYLLGADGEVRAVLGSIGPPLGMFWDRDYPSSGRIDVAPGDLLILLTDGITENMDGRDRMFGMERVLEVIREHRQKPVEQILQHVCQAAHDFAAPHPQADDMAIVICRRTG